MSTPCVTWGERAAGMLDPEAPPEQAAAFIAHLPGCPGCRAVVAQVVRCERLLATAAVLRTPLSVPQRRHSTATIRRVTTTVRRRKARPVSFLPWAAGLAALLAIGVLIGVTGRESEPGFAMVENATALSSAGRSIGAGTELNAGVELRGGPAQLRLADGTRVWLDADTRVSLTQGGTLRGGGRAGVLMRLDDGALGVSAKPQDPAAPLAVQTPLAESVVVGTAFRMSHSSSGSELTVSSGTVKLVDADGERMVQAGGHARVDAAPPPANLLAGFSASSVVGTVARDQPIRGWGGTDGLFALPPSGLEQPLLRQLDGGHGLCFNGQKRRLGVALPGVDARHGLTLIALFIPIDGGRDQRVIAVMDGNREQLALVRHDLQPGAVAVAIDGQERLRQDIPTGRHWSVAARWLPDGALVLNTGAGAGRRASATPPPTFAQPHLLFGGSPTGKALIGDIVAVELHAGVLDDAALTARVRALASANRFRLTTW